MSDLFANLYSLVWIIITISYLPQITALVRAKQKTENVSVSSWLMWTLAAAISMGYGIFCLHDLHFCVVTGVGLFLTTTITTLLIHNIHFRFEPKGNWKLKSRELYYRIVTGGFVARGAGRIRARMQRVKKAR